jgi:DUF1680 family protein
MGHEMYCGGHLIEGAVAYYNHGEASLPDAMIRWAEHVDGVFVTGLGNQGRLLRASRGRTGPHLPLEEATGDRRWGRLAEHFLDVRGRHPGCWTVGHR